MFNNNRKISYKEKFEDHFDDIIKYLTEKSPQTAKEFAQEVKDKLNKIENTPTANPIEPSLPSKQKWFRFAIVKKRWKIIFKVTNKVLIFLGIVHTSRHPKEIKKLQKNIRKK